MSNNIIKFFKGFAVGNFPISKQAERAVFEQNVESLFAAGTDLMQIASDSNYMPNPQYGHLVLWRERST